MKLNVSTLPFLLVICITTAVVTSCDKDTGGDRQDETIAIPDQRTQKKNKKMDHEEKEEHSSLDDFGLEETKNFEPCESWDFSGNETVQEYVHSKIELSIDCPSLKMSSAGIPSVIEKYKTDYIPQVLSQLKDQRVKILNLDVIPQNITISNYAKRAFGTGTWIVPATSESNRVQYFVDREVSFQRVEKDLFDGKVFITTGVWADSASNDVVFGSWQQSDWDKAKEKLAQIKASILGQSDMVQIISLPLSTNQTKEIYNMEYNPREKVLQLPFEIKSELIEYFISNIVPLKSQLQEKIGMTSVSLNFYNSSSSSAVSYMMGSSSMTGDKLFSGYKKLLASLIDIGDEIADAVKRNNVRLIRFYKIKGFSFNSYHTVGDSILNVVVAQEDLIAVADLVRMDDLKSCLAVISSGRQVSECRVQFDE